METLDIPPSLMLWWKPERGAERPPSVPTRCVGTSKQARLGLLETDDAGESGAGESGAIELGAGEGGVG